LIRHKKRGRGRPTRTDVADEKAAVDKSKKKQKRKREPATS
jgi:hypothetical protein